MPLKAPKASCEPSHCWVAWACRQPSHQHDSAEAKRLCRIEQQQGNQLITLQEGATASPQTGIKSAALSAAGYAVRQLQLPSIEQKCHLSCCTAMLCMHDWPRHIGQIGTYVQKSSPDDAVNRINAVCLMVHIQRPEVLYAKQVPALAINEQHPHSCSSSLPRCRQSCHMGQL